MSAPHENALTDFANAFTKAKEALGEKHSATFAEIERCIRDQDTKGLEKLQQEIKSKIPQQ